MIYDDAPISTLKEGQHIGHIKPAQLPYGLPLRELSERTTSAAKSRNMVALGYLAGLYGMPRAPFHDIGGKFKGKAAAIAEGNIRAFHAWATRRARRRSGSISSSSERRPRAAAMP